LVSIYPTHSRTSHINQIHSDVVGFYFLDLATNYKPAEDLAKFLADGPPPVYIGYISFCPSRRTMHDILLSRFGSVVVENPKAMTGSPYCKLSCHHILTHPLETIFQATAQANVRALVSAGWGGLGGVSIPPHIFILGNVPHDWLFEKVSAVVHHGGAGTTAIGLKKGCPTIVVPFFGVSRVFTVDQQRQSNRYNV